MAEKIVSPGVFTRENDLSFLSQGIGEIGAAVIGPFKKGPAFLPTVVNTQSEFEEIFGTPDGSYYTGYTVQNYLREAGTVTIVRVGHTGGYTQTKPIGIVSSGSVSGTKIVGTIFETHNGSGTLAGSTIGASVSASKFEITLVGESGISASINPTDGNDIGDVFGVNPRGTKDGYVYNYFEKASADAITNGQEQISLISLSDQDFSTDVQHASTPWIQSQLVSGERHNLFKIHSLGDGTIYNGEYKVSVFNVKAAGSSNATDYATFSLMIRKGDDTDKRKTVLETFNNLNLDPASPNYIKKVIGDRNLSIDSLGKQTENGDYPNRSKFVRVECVTEGSFPIVAGPFAHDKYYNPVLVGNEGSHGFGESSIPSVLFNTGSDANNSSKSVSFSGIDLETVQVKIDNNNYLAPLPASATQGGNTVFAFDGTVSIVGGTKAYGYELTGSLSADINKRQFTVGFQGGFDGCNPTISIDLGTSISSGNSQGFNLSTSTSSGSVGYVKGINSVSNPDDFDINLVSVPGIVRYHHSYVFDKVVDMCEAREDAFFIGDVVGASESISQAIEQGIAIDSNYVGTYYPWVKTIDSRTNKLISVPPSVLMPGIYASNDAVAAEWFAPAGLNRGGIVGAISVLNRLTHAERDELYEGKINPIAQFPGEGIVAFGQKTLQDKASALDRINVRRLMIKVKKYIASTSRYLVFEQNTSQTRGKFLNTVNPYLEGIQQRQGLYAFRVVMDESNNTPDVIDRNILAGQIFLQPTKTAEFIVLDFNILPTGASFTA
tara:strand:- start:224 stop:2554 length:2331 start_codon:yes stop_codon:yes gene_type:complete